MSPASFTWLRRIGSIFSITNQLFHNHSCQCKLSNTVLCTMKEMKMSLSNRCILFMYRSVTLFKHTSRYAYIIIFKTYIYIYAVETPHLQSIARTPGNCQAPRLSNSSRTRSPSAGSGSCALRRCPQTRCVIPVRRAHISPTEGLQWVHGYRYTMLYTHTHTYRHTYVRTYTHIRTYVRTYRQTDRQTYIHACMHMYIRIIYI